MGQNETEKAVEVVVTSVGVAASNKILSSWWNFWRSTEKALEVVVTNVGVAASKSFFLHGELLAKYREGRGGCDDQCRCCNK